VGDREGGKLRRIVRACCDGKTSVKITGDRYRCLQEGSDSETTTVQIETQLQNDGMDEKKMKFIEKFFLVIKASIL